MTNLEWIRTANKKDSKMPIKNLLEIMMLFRENAGLKLETTLYDDFAVLSNNKFKIIVMGREKRADNE